MDSKDLEVRYVAGFGECLVAKRAFKKGEAVISEAPLLSYSLNEPWVKDVRSAFQRSNLPGKSELHENAGGWLIDVLCFVRCGDQGKRERMLAMFAPGDYPDGMNDEEQKIVEAARAFADWAAELTTSFTAVIEIPDLALVADLDVATIARVVLIWNCNSHSFQGGAAIFERAVKMNHVCAGRNTWYVARNGLGEQLAMRDIAAGEQITTSYITALKGARSRNAFLQKSKFFTCTCAECVSGKDQFGAISCSYCVPYSLDLEGISWEEEFNSIDDPIYAPGQSNVFSQLLNGGADMNVHVPERCEWVAERGLWLCLECNQYVDPKPLWGAEDAGEQMLQKLQRDVKRELELGLICTKGPEVRRLLVRFLDILGPKHWLSQTTSMLYCDTGDLQPEQVYIVVKEIIRWGRGQSELQVSGWLYRSLQKYPGEWAFYKLHGAFQREGCWLDPSGDQMRLLEELRKFVIKEKATENSKCISPQNLSVYVCTEAI